MTTVSLVVNLPNVPNQAQAKQWFAQFGPDLTAMYLEAKGIEPVENALAGIKLIVLGFPPGDYAPAKAGVVHDRTALEKIGGGTVPYSFALSDDPAAERSPYSLWVMDFEEE